MYKLISQSTYFRGNIVTLYNQRVAKKYKAQNNSMPTITRKIKMHLCTEGLSEEERKAQWSLLYNINDNLYRVANNISSKLYLDEHVDSMVRLKSPEYNAVLKELNKTKNKAEKADDTQKAEYQKTIAELEARKKELLSEMSVQEKAIREYATEMATRSLAYKFANELKSDIYGQILAQVQSIVFKNFENDSKEVKEGKRSIRTYKKGMPIPFPWNKSISIEVQKQDSSVDHVYEFYLRWYGGLKFHLDFGKDRSNNRLILKRCLGLDEQCNGKYELQTSSIQLKKGSQGMELYLLLVVNIPKEQHTLNKNITVGVDLGINVPAYVATNCTEDRMAIGDRDHFLNTRLAFQRRFHSFQRLKGTAEGRGRKKKLKPLERLRAKERNWVRTQNHIFSRDVIKFAIKVNAATIQMEDLSGYGKDKYGNVDEDKKFLLGKWSYYELQNMIKYKANLAGIKVNMVQPAYTSQTCSWCGEKGVRESILFTCQNPNCSQYGKEKHADYNAARNIAKSNRIVKND